MRAHSKSIGSAPDATTASPRVSVDINETAGLTSATNEPGACTPSATATPKPRNSISNSDQDSDLIACYANLNVLKKHKLKVFAVFALVNTLVSIGLVALTVFSNSEITGTVAKDPLAAGVAQNIQYAHEVLYLTTNIASYSAVQGVSNGLDRDGSPWIQRIVQFSNLPSEYRRELLDLDPDLFAGDDSTILDRSQAGFIELLVSAELEPNPTINREGAITFVEGTAYPARIQEYFDDASDVMEHLTEDEEDHRNFAMMLLNIAFAIAIVAIAVLPTGLILLNRTEKKIRQQNFKVIMAIKRTINSLSPELQEQRNKKTENVSNNLTQSLQDARVVMFRTMVFLTTIQVLIYVGLLVMNRVSADMVQNTLSNDYKLGVAAGNVQFYDEALTSSAYVFAYSQNNFWFDHYIDNIPPLDEAIGFVDENSPTDISTAFIESTSVANDRLIELETFVLDVAACTENITDDVHLGIDFSVLNYTLNPVDHCENPRFVNFTLEEAQAVLLGDEYSDNKLIYQSGIANLRGFLAQEAKDNEDAVQIMTVTAVVLSITSFVVLACCLIFLKRKESTVQSLMSQTAVQLEWSALRILKNRVSAALFFEFAKERHSQEAIEFWLGVENARLPAERLNLIARFIKPGAKEQVNISHVLMNDILCAQRQFMEMGKDEDLQELQVTLKSAQDEVYVLISNNLHAEFIVTPKFLKFADRQRAALNIIDTFQQGKKERVKALKSPKSPKSPRRGKGSAVPQSPSSNSSARSN